MTKQEEQIFSKYVSNGTLVITEEMLNELADLYMSEHPELFSHDEATRKFQKSMYIAGLSQGMKNCIENSN